MFTKIKIPAGIMATLLLLLFTACEKIDIGFQDNELEDNPDVVEIDNLTVEMGTIKQDTMLTSGSGKIFVGTYTDGYFGKVSASTYAEIEFPATNPLLGKQIRLDSICLILKPTGSYKGDTTLPFKISVHTLQENIKNANGTDGYYNTRSFAYNSAAIAEASALIKPSLQKEWAIRLPDAMGNEWIQKLVSNANEFQTQESFRNFFKGLVISSDSNSNNSMYYFTGDSTSLIRLYYKELGLYNEAKELEFAFSTGKSFYHYDYNYSNTNLAQADPRRKQYFTSAVTGNKVFFSSLAPASVKFSFPDILLLKERFPELKVIKATLEIKPKQGSYFYPATLPAQLYLNETTSDNYAGNYIYYSDGQTPQEGGLVYDPLNYTNTKYSFNITSFINELIAEGQFSTKALMFTNAYNSLEESVQLVLNDQTVQNDIKLKVYVLEL